MDRAIRDVKSNQIDGIVTAPINKNAMKMSGFNFPGHTEFIAHSYNSKRDLMMFVSDSMKMALATKHVPLKDVPQMITKDFISSRLEVFNKTLIEDFGIERPTIAVLGLNPHAGEDGNIGNEEETEIRPAIIEAKKNGMMVMGPYSADGFFGSGMYRKFDGIMAMYHDQGLIPFKALSFGDGVNFTAGLPIIRTSPDHGTGYDIVGKNVADASSITKAIYCAIDIIRSRKEYFESRENALVSE